MINAGSKTVLVLLCSPRFPSSIHNSHGYLHACPRILVLVLCVPCGLLLLRWSATAALCGAFIVWYLRGIPQQLQYHHGTWYTTTTVNFIPVYRTHLPLTGTTKFSNNSTAVRGWRAAYTGGTVQLFEFLPSLDLSVFCVTFFTTSACTNTTLVAKPRYPTGVVTAAHRYIFTAMTYPSQPSPNPDTHIALCS